MPGQQAINPAISVFHFTSKVSTAKIRKYELAAAKDMGTTRRGTKVPTPVVPSTRTTRSNSNTSQEPPAKKPRLKLNFRKPSSNDGDTIAVSRPKRASAGRSRYSEQALISDDEVEDVTIKQSPAASSGLSSPASTPVSVKDDIIATTAKSGGRESYGDFMSYYIADGDVAEDEPAPKPRRKVKKEKPIAQEKQQRKPRVNNVPTLQSMTPVNNQSQLASQASLPPVTRPRSRHNSMPKNVTGPRPVATHPQINPNARPSPAVRPPPAQIPMPPPMPPPRHIPEPPVLEEITVKYHASVPQKVKKLQILSAALTSFGGVPNSGKISVPEASRKPDIKAVEKKKTDVKEPRKDGAPVDNFLAMFDDEDSDEKDDSDLEVEVEVNSQDQEPRFLEYTGEPDGPLTYGIQFIMNALKSWAQQRLNQQYAQQARVPPPTAPNNGNGTPDALPTTERPTIPIKPSLSNTPEGQAIAAFRDVVESGCLQVNVILPADLAGAVRHLYVQIDQLINQGGKPPPEPWQPMSYSAQLKAHQIRLEQAMSQHGMMGYHPMHNTMGPPSMPGVHPGHMHLPNQMHGSSDRRRSTPYIHGQSIDGHPSRMSLPGVAGMPSPGLTGSFPGSPPVTANYRLPRSGQTMNFSFAPENMAAIQAFGPGAFPSLNQNQGSNLPNRGPMSASPVVKSSPALPMSHDLPTSGGGDVKSSSAEIAHQPVEVSSTDTHAHPAPARAPRQSSGFTAVNAPARTAHDTRASASTSRRRSPGLTKSDAVVLEDD